jgi:hypothetical protein
MGELGVSNKIMNSRGLPEAWTPRPMQGIETSGLKTQWQKIHNGEDRPRKNA